MNCWTRVVGYWYYIWTPAPPSREEARERLAKAKPWLDEQQKLWDTIELPEGVPEVSGRLRSMKKR